ncbi:MAG: efflux RND transporter periplasmic adaptor subunit [Paludibacter sp.]|nr:efflux RND transporter periplasmic adaptor subunit [Paludibacter sp.]
MKKKKIIWIIIIAIILLAIVVMVFFKDKKVVDVTTYNVDSGKVSVTVTSTGYIQPVQQVSVGTQVSGVIEKIFVDFNSVVKKGDLLATLDMSVLNERLYQANAALSAAQSALTLAQQTYDRTEALFDQKAETQTNMEAAANSLSQAKTNVGNAKSNVKQANINLSYAKIYSPINGVILNRAVDEGQTVAASFNTPTLFLIANDLTKMQVQANMDEADVGGLANGQKVSFTVDAYPDLTFDGTIEQVRLNAITTNNVVTYTVIVNAPNPDKKLFPGMTANITVTIEEEEGLVVPMEALQFTPSADVEKQLKITQPPTAENKQQALPKGKTNKKRNGVWIQNDDGSLTFTPVETGLSDGFNTIVKKGLNQGQKVVLSAMWGVKSTKNEAVANPLMPQRPQRQRQQNTGTPPRQ